MPTVMLENISVELYQQLEQGAHVHQRSVSSEIVSYLEQMLRQRPCPKKFFSDDASRQGRPRIARRFIGGLCRRAWNET